MAKRWRSTWHDAIIKSDSYLKTHQWLITFNISDTLIQRINIMLKQETEVFQCDWSKQKDNWWQWWIESEKKERTDKQSMGLGDIKIIPYKRSVFSLKLFKNWISHIYVTIWWKLINHMFPYWVLTISIQVEMQSRKNKRILSLSIPFNWQKIFVNSWLLLSEKIYSVIM